VHQTTLTSSDLVWDAELAAIAETTVTRGPTCSAHPDGLVVRWRTNLATASEVRVGPRRSARHVVQRRRAHD